jgi:hypothetical protein
MAKAVLGQFLDLGTSGERGSYALSKDKSSFFYNALEAVLLDISDAINNYVIADLAQYNFGQDAAFPRIRFKPLNDETADAVLETYRQIIMANTPNITPTFMLQLMKRVEEILGLELDPLSEYSNEEYLEVLKTIPTAREHLLSKESRAGAGQNATTGVDKNATTKVAAVLLPKPGMESARKPSPSRVALVRRGRHRKPDARPEGTDQAEEGKEVRQIMETFELTLAPNSDLLLELARRKKSNFDGIPSKHPERKGQLNKSKLKNWVEKNGGLPTYINSIATALLREHPGWGIGRVIATAVNMVKKMCAGGGTGIVKKVSTAVKKAACAAVASWNKKKATRRKKLTRTRLK